MLNFLRKWWNPSVQKQLLKNSRQLINDTGELLKEFRLDLRLRKRPVALQLKIDQIEDFYISRFENKDYNDFYNQWKKDGLDQYINIDRARWNAEFTRLDHKYLVLQLTKNGRFNAYYE